MKTLRFAAAAALVLAAGACADDPVPAPSPPGADPGTSTSVEPTVDPPADLAAIQKELAACELLGAADLIQKHALAQTAGVAYDPAQAEGLALIQSSALGLDADESAALASMGFVISNRKQFPTFV